MRAALCCAVLLACVAGAPARARAHRCAFGTTPGGWLALEAGTQPDKHGKELNYNRLDDTPESVWLPTSKEDPAVPFGSNWYSVDPACPLRNLLTPYWAPAPPPGAPPPAPPVTIVFLGDSIDAHFLDYLCSEYARRNPGDSGWRAWVHSHAMANYCLLPSGLRLVQVYLLRHSAEDDARRMEAVVRLLAGDDDASRYDGVGDRAAQLAARAREVAVLKGAAPALVVFSSAYWPLQHFASSFGDEMTPVLLPPDFVGAFANSTRALVQGARVAFPGAMLALHTSAGIRTDPEFGTNVDHSNKRIWGKKTYVAQLNAGLRHVAAAEHARLVDFEMMSSALTARQYTADDVHPRSFFSFEVLNVYLNMIEEQRAWEAEHPGGVGADIAAAIAHVHDLHTQ